MKRVVPIILVVGVVAATVVFSRHYWKSGPSDPAPPIAHLPGEAQKPASSLSPAVPPSALPDRQTEPAPGQTRDAFVRDNVQTLLNAYPDVADVSEVKCQDLHCRVTLEVPHMKPFTPVFERLQDTTFIGIAESILLANPVPIDDAGAHRVTFTLEFATPSKID